MSKKFGSLEKVRIFAARLRKNGLRSSLKRLITVQEASTEKNTIYREALISLEIIHDELSRQRQGARDVLEGSYLLVVTDKI